MGRTKLVRFNTQMEFDPSALQRRRENKLCIRTYKVERCPVHINGSAHKLLNPNIQTQVHLLQIFKFHIQQSSEILFYLHFSQNLSP